MKRARRLSAVCAAVAMAAGFGCNVATLRAESANPQTYDLKDCEQDDRAWLALRACTSLLKSADLADQDRSRIQARRGLAWITEDDASEAVADFSRALELDSNNVRALVGRARAYTLLANYDAARKDWTSVLALDPNSQDVRLKRAASHLAFGDAASALADYNAVVANDPNNIEGYIGRAIAYVAIKDRDAAMKEFDRAQALDPGNFAPYLARAEAAEVWGDTKLAITNYSKALSLKTTVWAARKALKRLGIDTPP